MTNISGTRRVVITGVGAVSPAGLGAGALFDAACAGRCAIGALDTAAARDVDVHVAGVVRDFDGHACGLNKKQARRWSRFVQFGAVAADEAMQDAGVIVPGACADDPRADTPWQLAPGINPARFATVFGSGIGGMQIFSDESVKLHERGAKRVSPLFIPSMISNIAAGELAIRFGLQGECTNSVVACATGTQCIGDAYRLIKFGLADAALAGGAEEALCDISIAGFANLGALTHAKDPARASRPFDAERDGFVAGEGAGALVLESLDHALARGAHIYAEVAGFGTSCDAHHVTAPDPAGTGVARAMQIALDEAGATACDLGHLNAHGTSTQLNDATESAALAIVCKDAGVDVADVPVTSTKGITGHMLGAAGAVEAIVTALSVAGDVVPPTAGFATPSPDCPVSVLTEARTGAAQKLAISNSIGFGGHNTALAIAKYTD